MKSDKSKLQQNKSVRRAGFVVENDNPIRQKISELEDEIRLRTEELHKSNEERLHAEAEQERGNRRLQHILESISDGFATLDKDFRYTYINKQGAQMLGLKAKELLGKSVRDVFSKRENEGYIKACAEALTGQQTVIFDDYFAGMDRWFAARFYPTAEGVAIYYRDITQEKRAAESLRKSEQRFKSLIENSSDVLVLVDASGKTTYVSPSVTHVLGYNQDDFIDHNGFELVHPDDYAEVMREFGDLAVESGKTITREVRVKHIDGTWRWVETTSTNLIDDPSVHSIVVNFRDVNDRKLAENRVYHHFYHDNLTDLPNRNLFSDRLSMVLSESKRSNQMFGVIVIDLDRFKIINESLGHAIGDRLIQEVALRLRRCVDGSDMLSRLGGDEFGILVTDIVREEEIGKICQKILEILKPALKLDEHELYVTPSIGISVYPHDGHDSSTLMRNAEAALYRAKEQGRNNFQFYTPAMNAKAFERLSLESMLRKAMENNEFVVYYHPQIEVKTGKIVQVEALIRWMHPELGLTFPEEFIGLAETTGLIEQIGEWVLRTAMVQVKAWHIMGFAELRLAVNISARQFKQKHLVRMIHKLINDTGFDPNRLELELTESIIIDKSPTAGNTLRELKKNGIKFAIDDFNTGYASLNYIKTLPIDVIKIDKSFVKGIPIKEKDTAIANSIINLAHSLNMTVVAEGVERQEQFQFLQQQKCDLVQGYLFSPPVEPGQMIDLLRKNRSWPNTDKGM